MSRPSSFNQETADNLCDWLIAGKSLRSFCQEGGNPAASTICRWLASDEAFRKQYAHAREVQADTLFDESLDIADDETGDLIAEDEDQKIVRGNGVKVQRDKLRIETRKWMAGKLAPKRYGEKQEIEHSGGLTVHTIELVALESPDSTSS